MHISGFHIDGFGIYHDQGVHDLPLGLVLFVGDNESGKTTLMAFLRTVLFGFKRKGTRNDYQPWRGGGHGGRLALLMEDGRHIAIERLGRQATIASDGGAPERGEPGEHLLGGIDRATFEHIFAIGLEELQGLEVLTQEGVRGRLFSASAGLGGASMPAALKSIDEKLAALWAPRAKKRLNLLTDRLREITKDIKNLQGQAADYAACQRQKEELEERVHRERVEMEDIRRRLRRLDQLEQAREPWAVLLTARQKAHDLEAVKNFPANGLEQLEHLKNDLEKNRLSLLDREAEAARLQERLDQTGLDEGLLAQREHIEALFGEREKIASVLTGLPALRHSLSQAEGECQGRLKDLGPDWDAARLSRVDTSVAVRQQVQDFGYRLDLLERRLEQFKSQERFLGEEAEAARRRLEEANRRVAQAPSPPLSDINQLRDKKEILTLLRTLSHRRDLSAAQLQDRRLRREDVALRLSSLSGQLGTGYDPIPWWVGVPIAMTGFVLAVFLSTYVSHLAGNLAFLAVLIVTGLIYLGRQRLLNREKRRRTQLEEEARLVEQRALALDAEISDLEDSLTDLNEDLTKESLKVADSPLSDLADLERLAADLDQAAQHLQARLTLEHDKTKAEEACEESQNRLLKARQETQEAEQEHEALQKQWRSCVVNHGFPEAARPEAFEGVLQAVERAREAESKVAEIRHRLQETENYLESAKTRISSLIEACGRSIQGDAAGVEDLDALRRDLSDALEMQRARRDLENNLAALQEHIGHLKGLSQDKIQELQGLLEQAGAHNEEEFRRLAGLYQDYRECLKRLEQSDIALLTIAGNPEAQTGLAEELSQADPLELDREKEELTARLEVLSESLPRADQEVGRLTHHLGQMAQDEKLGDLLQEQSVLEEQLQEAMQRWAVLAISRHLIEEARGVYERERQPQVIREADRFLGLMTGERYRLVSSLGDGSVHLEDRSLKRKDQIHWSDGLADQVYLAVRLGLAREFSRHAEPLPVILDDVLVKFDPRRRRGAARVILEFAREQQVLLFTCHPEFEKIIASLHQEDYFQETPVSYFHIADGMIQRGGPPGSA